MECRLLAIFELKASTGDFRSAPDSECGLNKL